MKTIKGNLIMESDMTFEEDLKVEGSISGKDGNRYNLIVKGDLDCYDLDCGNLDCGNLDCKGDVFYYAVAFAYNNIKCKSIKGRWKNARHFVLDGKIEISGEKLT